MKMKFGVLAGTIVAMTMAFAGQAVAQDTDAEQLARMKDPDQWPAPGRDFAVDAPQRACRHYDQEREQAADGLAAGHERPSRS